jgi:hypothetical protein
VVNGAGALDAQLSGHAAGTADARRGVDAAVLGIPTFVDSEFSGELIVFLRQPLLQRIQKLENSPEWRTDAKYKANAARLIVSYSLAPTGYRLTTISSVAACASYSRWLSDVI